MSSHDIRPLVGELLKAQAVGVLATSAAGAPYTTLVAFCATRNLRHILFTTARATRKFKNLTNDPRASLLVDNRVNSEEDFHAARAVTAVGPVREVDKERESDLLELFYAKHPYLREFADAPTVALMCLDIQRYVLVERFQQVRETETSSWR